MHDIEHLKYHDARLEPAGSMTREQLDIWTSAIDQKS
jgi:hypothetical protein